MTLQDVDIWATGPPCDIDLSMWSAMSCDLLRKLCAIFHYFAPSNHQEADVSRASKWQALTQHLETLVRDRTLSRAAVFPKLVQWVCAHDPDVSRHEDCFEVRLITLSRSTK